LNDRHFSAGHSRGKGLADRIFPIIEAQRAGMPASIRLNFNANIKYQSDRFGVAGAQKMTAREWTTDIVAVGEGVMTTAAFGEDCP
jgi:hypothetical protein